MYFTLKDLILLFLRSLSGATECLSHGEVIKNFLPPPRVFVFEILLKVESLEVTNLTVNAVIVLLIGNALNKGSMYKLFIHMEFMINRCQLSSSAHWKNALKLF